MFKRHQKVKILVAPAQEYIEYSEEYAEQKTEIKKGMNGEVNIILPNGQYHVKIINEKSETIAYAPFDEECLEIFYWLSQNLSGLFAVLWDPGKSAMKRTAD